jgi:hypothetical protein
VLDRELRRTHGLLSAMRNEKDETMYLARQEKAILANELRNRHQEALAALDASERERKEVAHREQAHAASRVALQTSAQALAADAAAAEATASAARAEVSALKAAEAPRARQLMRALEEAASLAGRLEGREEAGGVHAATVEQLGETLFAHNARADGTLHLLSERVATLSRLIGGPAELNGTSGANGANGVNGASASGADGGEAFLTPRQLAAAVAAEHSSKVDSSVSSLVGMVDGLRSDAALQHKNDALSGAMLKQHRLLTESSLRMRDLGTQCRKALATVETLLANPDATAAAAQTPWPTADEDEAASTEERLGALPPLGMSVDNLIGAVEAEQARMREQLRGLLRSCGSALNACTSLRDELSTCRDELRAARAREAAAEGVRGERQAEHGKDKAFLLTVVDTLKEQLSAERVERTKMRTALEAASANHTAALDALGASHAAALAPHAAAEETCRNARRACRALHGRLEAFCSAVRTASVERATRRATIAPTHSAPPRRCSPLGCAAAAAARSGCRTARTPRSWRCSRR